MAENMTDNAKYIYNFFRNKGWSSQSICGMLGNMQGESGVIADIDEKGGGTGYGLVQWTPKSKLVNWANSKGYNYRTVDTQCKRIQWELDNSEQFYKTSAYPLTFKQFTQSTSSPTYLAQVFINNYERPANPNQPKRWEWAESWYKLLANGQTPPGNGSSNSNVKSFQSWLNNNYKSGLTVDGVYGANTKKAATIAYQRVLGVTADGIFGSGSQAAVVALKNGSKGNAVVLLQGMLYCLGYNPNGLDGIYGAGCVSAVKSYQSAKKLTADGIAGSGTMKAIYG